MTSLAYGYIDRVINLFTFSHGGNRNKQGGLLSLMRLVALSSFKSVRYSDVAVRYFEDLLQHFYKKSFDFTCTHGMQLWSQVRTKFTERSGVNVKGVEQWSPKCEVIAIECGSSCT